MKYKLGFSRIGLILLLWLQCSHLFAALPEGVDAYEKGQFANALQHLLPIADEGVAEAQYYLGMMYEDGKGVRADPVQAREWYERAAQAGHAGAQFQLGRIFAEGKGVAADGAKASRWYLLAAGQGNLDAQYSLGTMFKQGKGVPVDMVQAYLWFSRAAEQGLGNARVQQDYLAKKLTPAELDAAHNILTEVERARDAAAREAEQERVRRAQQAADRKAALLAKQAAEKQAQEDAARRSAEEAARRDAARQAQQQAAASAEAARVAAERARQDEQRAAQALAAERSEHDELLAMFMADFEKDAAEAAERLQKFHPDGSILPASVLSVDKLKVTDMDDGARMVYVKYVMRKLQKGDEEPTVKEATKWFKVRHGESGYELVRE